MSVTYTATPSMREETVLYLSNLLHAEHQWRGTRAGTRAGNRALGLPQQVVLVVRWFLGAVV